MLVGHAKEGDYYHSEKGNFLYTGTKKEHWQNPEYWEALGGKCGGKLSKKYQSVYNEHKNKSFPTQITCSYGGGQVIFNSKKELKEYYEELSRIEKGGKQSAMDRLRILREKYSTEILKQPYDKLSPMQKEAVDRAVDRIIDVVSLRKRIKALAKFKAPAFQEEKRMLEAELAAKGGKRETKLVLSDSWKFQKLYEKGYSLNYIAKKMRIRPEHANYLLWEDQKYSGKGGKRYRVWVTPEGESKAIRTNKTFKDKKEAETWANIETAAGMGENYEVRGGKSASLPKSVVLAEIRKMKRELALGEMESTGDRRHKALIKQQKKEIKELEDYLQFGGKYPTSKKYPHYIIIQDEYKGKITIADTKSGRVFDITKKELKKYKPVLIGGKIKAGDRIVTKHLFVPKYHKVAKVEGDYVFTEPITYLSERKSDLAVEHQSIFLKKDVKVVK